MGKNKILLVDDEVDFLTLMSRRLQSMGYVIETAPCGLVCLEKVHSFMPDLILLDLRMPRKDGWEVCEELSKSPSTKDIPVLLLTAMSQGDVEKRAAQLGVKEVLSKPLDSGKLFQLIKEHLGDDHP